MLITFRKLQVLPAEDLDFIKTEVKDIALSSFPTFNKNVRQHLPIGEINLYLTKVILQL